MNRIRIGSMSSIGENAVVHVAKFNGDRGTTIGDFVTVRPNAIVHACTLEDRCIVGAGATVMDGAVVGKDAVVAAGAVVTANKSVPSGQLWAGNPAKFLRELTAEERTYIQHAAEDTASLARAHAVEAAKSWDDLKRDDLAEFQRRDAAQEFRAMADPISEAHLAVRGEVFQSDAVTHNSFAGRFAPGTAPTPLPPAAPAPAKLPPPRP